jgi:hypothetical protein
MFIERGWQSKALLIAVQADRRRSMSLAAAGRNTTILA